MSVCVPEEEISGTVYRVDIDFFFVIGKAIASMVKNMIQNIGSIDINILELWDLK